MPLYETSFAIRQFMGLNQSGDGYNMDMRYAREMENVNITGGSFTPMREGHQISQTLHDPIGTLAYLHRRFGTEGTLLVAISNGSVYTKALDGDDDWALQYTGLTVNDCDWVTYEVNYKDGDPLPEPVDVLLFSNAEDGMFCLYGDDLTVVQVTTPKKFGVIARFNERIWGGGITGDPDMLVYSAPFDPFDWEARTEIPEDGAGDIMQPTWDGDSFLALKQYGNVLLAIKRNSIWRISGTNPGEFVMQQQYGGGTIAENTVAIYNDFAYMLGEYGLMRYDGSGAFPFQQDALQTLMREQVNRRLNAVDYPQYSSTRKYFPGDRCQYLNVFYKCRESTTGTFDNTCWEQLRANPMIAACAGMWNGVYCLALPTGDSDYCDTILQYDTLSRAFSLRTGVSVESFLQINERLFYTSARYPGRVFELDDTQGEVRPVKWISGYQDLGVKNSIKSAFVFYAMVECEVPVELWLGIRTEKKWKEKKVTIRPGKLKRVNLNTQGRVFRLEIRSYQAIPYTIAGGIKVDLELDPD